MAFGLACSSSCAQLASMHTHISHSLHIVRLVAVTQQHEALGLGHCDGLHGLLGRVGSGVAAEHAVSRWQAPSAQASCHKHMRLNETCANCGEKRICREGNARDHSVCNQFMR